MIDMDDLLGDDDFFQPMTIYRRQIMPSTSGVQPVQTTLITPAPLGSIQSGANPQLLRLSDFATAGNVITVYTAFPLYEDTTIIGGNLWPDGTTPTDAYGNAITPDGQLSFKSDIIVFHGDPYEVFATQDFTDYGLGFIEATCRKVTTAQAGIALTGYSPTPIADGSLNFTNPGNAGYLGSF